MLSITSCLSIAFNQFKFSLLECDQLNSFIISNKFTNKTNQSVDFSKLNFSKTFSRF